MSYSYAFERLYMMSLKTDIMTRDKRDRVAFFLGRIVISERYTNYKDDAIRYLIEMSDNEWNMIKERMGERTHSKSMRMDWVRALDTIRAFH